MAFTDCTTNQERLDYLKGHPVRVDSQGMMDGSKKVGDASAITTAYRGIIRDVDVTGWRESASEAAKAAQDFMQTWDGSIS